MNKNISLEFWEKELGLLRVYENELFILNNRFLLIVIEENSKYSEISVYYYDLNSFSLLGSVKIEGLYYRKFHKHLENTFFF